ncbi:MAG: alpha/beta hydrolase [Coriobacteriaceae bacterium]|jgi:pimeloyl-ACP methyl ester carboxylesterase|nr:alpha/beta hydrolase [Coriobacteriaceae bacterium]
MIENTLKRPDCDVRYWFAKGGEHPLVFLHGAGCDHALFAPQFPAFAEETVIAWDARGHGESRLDKEFVFSDMLDDLSALLDDLGTCKATLIGQSMGGNLAQAFCKRHPSRVEKMVLIDCTRNTQRLSPIESFTLKLTKPLLALYPFKTLVEQSAKQCGLREQTRDYARDVFYRSSKDKMVEITLAVLKCLEEDKGYTTPVPTLLLCGRQDVSGNIRKSMPKWAESDPNCRLVWVENAGHCSNLDAPEFVNGEIEGFLRAV